MTGEPGNDGLRTARLRGAYLFGGLIAFLVVYSTIAHQAIDASVLGILVGGFVTAAGIEVATVIAKAVQSVRDDSDRKS